LSLTSDVFDVTASAFLQNSKKARLWNEATEILKSVNSEVSALPACCRMLVKRTGR
jgi:hypothetical protein